MKKNPQPSASKPKNPSTKSKKDSSSAIKENIETKEIFQALILADSFDKRFEPITLDSPRVIFCCFFISFHLNLNQIFSFKSLYYL